MTTRRPVLKHTRRPSSAVYVGPDPSIPDLPAPPSPETTTSNDGASTSGYSSGLPSPPATNSTDSGSTGDKSSLSARQRPVSLDSMQHQNHLHHFSNHDFDDENEGEDDTARLDRRLSFSTESTENDSALQRVKSLAERNRMVIDKLNSVSRTSSPVLSARTGLPPRSSAGSSAASSSSSSSHSRTNHYRTSSATSAIYDPHSGSDTERDSRRGYNDSYNSSVEDLSVTPPAPRSITPSSRTRLRSAPASPAKALLAQAGQATRKRVSMSLIDDDNDVAQAALAAVASSRRSPNTLLGNGSAKRRQPLPREFRDGGTDGRYSTEPFTPHRDRLAERERQRTLSHSLSPQKLPLRSSTLRELNRKHQTRWMSADMSSTSFDQDDETRVGRIQTTRGGSAESALGPSSTGHAQGRSLAGESLRAAGIGVAGSSRDHHDDLFGDRPASRLDDDFRERSRSRLGTLSRQGTRAPSALSRQQDYDEPYEEEDSYVQASNTRRLRPIKSAYPVLASERDRAPSSLSRQPPTSATTDRSFTSERRNASNGNGVPSTPSTSSEHTRLMTDSLTMFDTHLRKLPLSGPVSNEVLRNAQIIVGATERLNDFLRQGSAKAMEEHVNAEVGDMDDSDDTYRGSRDALPGDGTLSRAETWKQVSAEYRDGLRMSDELVRGLTGFLLGMGKVMRDVSGETNGALYHNRSISLPDDASSGIGERSGSSAGVAQRGTLGRLSLSPDIGLPNGSGNGSGRRSTESRRSWEPDENGVRRSALAGLANGRAVSSSMASPPPMGSGSRASGGGSTTSSASSNQQVRSTGSGGSGSASGVRRVITPQDRRELPLLKTRTPDVLASLDSQNSLDGYEPSPTPASRRQQLTDENTAANRVNGGPRSATIPAPIPALPSETPNTRNPLRRNISHAGGNTTEHTKYASPTTTTSATAASIRRVSKISTASASTVRGNVGAAPVFSLSSQSNAPTTAVTPHTVSTSPQQRAFPLTRTGSTISGSSRLSGNSRGSDGSAGANPRGTVTFAKSTSPPSAGKAAATISAASSKARSALSGLSQRDKESIHGRNASTRDTDSGGENAGTAGTMGRASGTTRVSRRSLDGASVLQQAAGTSSTVSPAGGSRRGLPPAQTQSSTVLPAGGRSKERRRTITEIFS